MSDVTAGRISALYRYPVKSMMGETLSEGLFSHQGLEGDRSWAVRDEKRGGIRGGKKLPQLMTLRAESHESAPQIVAPNGESRMASAPEINDWLSAVLDHPVSLWPLLPPEQLEHYRRGAPDHEDFEAELRAVFGRLPDEPLPDLSLFAEVIEFESPPGTYFDAFPVHLLSQQSLDTMAKRSPESVIDVRRFRPNILLDMPAAETPFPELSLIGKTIRFGEAEFEIVGDCPRCSMTTRGFAELPEDPGVMRKLVHEANGSLGIYAKVTREGRVASGDALELVG